jgi:hypothetical protein
VADKLASNEVILKARGRGGLNFTLSHTTQETGKVHLENGAKVVDGVPPGAFAAIMPWLQGKAGRTAHLGHGPWRPQPAGYSLAKFDQLTFLD